MFNPSPAWPPPTTTTSKSSDAEKFLENWIRARLKRPALNKLGLNIFRSLNLHNKNIKISADVLFKYFFLFVAFKPLLNFFQPLVGLLSVLCSSTQPLALGASTHLYVLKMLKFSARVCWIVITWNFIYS